MMFISRFFKSFAAVFVLFCTFVLLCTRAASSFAQTETEAAATTPADFAGLVEQLATGSLSERGDTVKQIALLKDPRSTVIIAALEQGRAAILHQRAEILRLRSVREFDLLPDRVHQRVGTGGEY